MREDIDDVTLARYLSGELSATRTAEVERWIAADAARAERLALLRAVWTRPALPEFDAGDAVWARLSAQVEPPLPRPRLVRNPAAERAPWLRARPHLRRTRYLAAAAAVVLLIGGALTMLQLRRPPSPVAMEETATVRGQRATVVLPDGSRAILAAESRLRYPARVSHWHRAGRARDLYLEGQAYFEVDYDETRPFRVHTPAGIVEDLGTEFVVTAYPETSATVVAVVSGAVALYRPPADSAGEAPSGARDERPLLTLARGDLARLDGSGEAVLTRDVNLAPYVAWTEWNLVFDATPMHEVAATLARWYDLDIRLADSALAERLLSASFRYEPISQVLELIARSLDARVERDGRSVVFTRDSSQASMQEG